MSHSRSSHSSGSSSHSYGSRNSQDDVSINVLNSIIDSRLEQIEALTMPSNKGRLDIIHAIQNIDQFPRKLSSFLDYLIDLTATLNVDLHNSQDELAELSDNYESLKSVKIQKQTVSTSDKRIERLSRMFGVKDDKLEDAIKQLKENKPPKKQENSQSYLEDYQKSLTLLKANKYHLSESVAEIIEQNEHLQRLHAEDRKLLTTQSQKIHKIKSAYYTKDDDGDVQHQTVNLDQLHHQFDKLEQDLSNLRSQVNNNLNVVQKRR